MHRLPSAARILAWAAAGFFAVSAGTQARADEAPPSPQSAALARLVPSGWSIERERRADFDADGRPDVLLLLRQDDAKGVAPRRMLLVALAKGGGAGYAVAARNDRLIPRDESGRIEDPMADGDIAVRSRGFDLKLGMMPAVGSYEAASLRFRFRYDGRCFRLVRYDRNETHRATLDTRDVSVSFLTGTVSHAVGNAQTGAERRWRDRLSSNPRRCLDDLDNAWTFDPLK